MDEYSIYEETPFGCFKLGYEAPDGSVIYCLDLLKHSTALEYTELPRRETNEPSISDLFNDHCVIGINERMIND